VTSANEHLLATSDPGSLLGRTSMSVQFHVVGRFDVVGYFGRFASGWTFTTSCACFSTSSKTAFRRYCCHHRPYVASRGLRLTIPILTSTRFDDRDPLSWRRLRPLLAHLVGARSTRPVAALLRVVDGLDGHGELTDGIAPSERLVDARQTFIEPSLDRLGLSTLRGIGGRWT
jgi:hypothetical protein